MWEGFRWSGIFRFLYRNKYFCVIGPGFLGCLLIGFMLHASSKMAIIISIIFFIYIKTTHKSQFPIYRSQYIKLVVPSPKPKTLR